MWVTVQCVCDLFRCYSYSTSQTTRTTVTITYLVFRQMRYTAIHLPLYIYIPDNYWLVWILFTSTHMLVWSGLIPGKGHSRKCLSLVVGPARTSADQLKDQLKDHLKSPHIAVLNCCHIIGYDGIWDKVQVNIS